MSPSRREFLAAAGTLALAGCTTSRSDDESAWEVVDSPIELSLYDVVTTKLGPFAVGEGGRVLERDDEEGWSIRYEHGPHAAGNGLVDATVTDNGGAMWFCGTDGAIGRYDVARDRVVDYTAPKHKTSQWESVAVVGLAGHEWVFLVNGSGELLRGRNHRGKMEWSDEVLKPGGGSSATSVEFDTNGFGYVCDTTSHVYQSASAGDSWKQIGIEGASVDLEDLAPYRTYALDVAAGDGIIYRFDGFNWTPIKRTDSTLNAITRTRRNGVAVGGGGSIVSFTSKGWQDVKSPVETTLNGVTLPSPDHPGLAVGDDGVIIERPN